MKSDILAFYGLEVEGKHKGLRTLFIQGKANSSYVDSMILKCGRQSSSAHVQNNGLDATKPSGSFEAQAEGIGKKSEGALQAPFDRPIEQVYFGATFKGKNCSEYSLGAVLVTCRKYPELIVTLDYEGVNRSPAFFCQKLRNLELMITVQCYATARTLRNIGWMHSVGIANKVQVKFRGPTVAVFPLTAAITNRSSEISEDTIL